MRRFLLLVFAGIIHLLVLLRVLAWVLPGLVLRTLFGDPYGRREPSADPRRPYLVLLSFIEWDGAWQRPQHLVSHLSGFLDAVCCAPLRAHNAPGRSLPLLFSHREVLTPGLTVLRPLLLPAENRSALIRALNAFILFDALQREVRLRGGEPEVLMTNSPFFALPFSWLPARLRVYDVMDELVRFSWAPPDATRLERLVMAQADLVTTGTKSLQRLKVHEYADLIAKSEYVPCGVDFAHFAQAAGPLPADLADLPSPRIGFFGALNERVDYEILEVLAREMPHASILLIGQVYQGLRRHLTHQSPGGAGRARVEHPFQTLQNLPNVHFLGPRPYAALPAYLAAFDCAIVPYRLTDGIEFVQPVKILEYLAGGKPVVSTAIPDVVELYGEVVRTAATPAGFVEQVRAALQSPEPPARELAATVCRRSWTDMAAQFAGLFQAARLERSIRPPQIVHLLHGVQFGGAEQVVADLSQALSAGRYRASVVCLGHGAVLKRRLDARGVPWNVVPMQGRLDFGVVFPLINILRSRRADLLHTHTGRTNLVGRLAGRISGLPVVSTIHTAVARDINDFRKSNGINAWVEKRTRGWSARLITVSGHNREELLRDGGVPGRVIHIPNGVPTIFPLPTPALLKAVCDEFPALHAPGPLVGMLAALRPRKGPEVLLRALPLVAAEFPSVRLLLVGSAEFVRNADYLERLKRLAAELGCADRALFTGHRDDTTTFLALMQVVVLPSLFGEGLPLTLLEAMALSKPVVATRTEGNEEVVVDGETGRLVPPGDPQALAEAILELLRTPALASERGWAGRKRVEAEYGLALMAERHASLYDQVLGDKFPAA